MFTKIAVPLDGSPLAEKALPYAVKIAELYKAQLLLLRVAELSPFTTDTTEHELAAVRTAENYLKDVKQSITDPDLDLFLEPEKVELLAVYGDRDSDLAELIPYEHADLIIMTTHGRTGFSRMVLGSVANKILRHTLLPIILIRPENIETSELVVEEMMETTSMSEGLKRVLVTLDGTPASESVVENAITLGRETGAEIILMQVINPIIPVEYGAPVTAFTFDLDKDLEERREAALDYLKKIEAKIEAEGIRCRCNIFVGNAAYEIVTYARKTHANLILMATHARGKFGQFLMGSVADQVVRETHLPVMLVHTYPPIKAQLEKDVGHLVGNAM
jgi:nucleotide-binding universal stress UspA family protein